MKLIKLFYDPNDAEVNDWILNMHKKAKVDTNGNVDFVVHDVKMSSFSRSDGMGTTEVRCAVMVIFSHTV